MRDFGGVISFVTKGNDFQKAISVVEKLKVFTLAESLGGVESLAGHPASMTHNNYTEEERQAHGISLGLARISVGLENVEDLSADILKALEKSSA